MPPAPVPVAAGTHPVPPALAPTMLIFSDGLAELSVTHPELKFQASLRRDAPESARFRVAVDSAGVVRYSFLDAILGRRGVGRTGQEYLARSAASRWRNNPIQTPR